ncbi:uncharacterized protein LOC141720097 [Apium graveolens]|uniref:uncharacterized protein LOC141720097 n=1 Tax=Apium graveolens TaxID=4045 RepID=UPI003D7B5F00
MKWSPPSRGCFKLNVDASVVMGDSSYAVGMVIRDDRGRFVQGKNMRFLGMVTVLEAEARGVQEALKWLEELNLRNVTIECDSKGVVKAVNNGTQYYLEVRHVFEWCRVRLGSRVDFYLCHVKKQKNQLAHLMARVQCLVNCYNVFLSPSELLLETLSSDYSV